MSNITSSYYKFKADRNTLNNWQVIDELCKPSKKDYKLDTKGFDDMVKQLKKYTNQDYKTIVRAVTNDVLLNTASTKFASAKKIRER